MTEKPESHSDQPSQQSHPSQPSQPSHADQPFRAGDLGKKVIYGDDKAFQAELRKRVDEYFRSAGYRPHDNWQMYLKIAIVLIGFVAAYVLLVFFAQNIWHGLALALLLAAFMTEIGFNIQHDGGHKAVSKHPWVNKVMGMTLDMVGASSYLWRRKHVVIHHTYVNITGYDTDIEFGLLGRMSPHAPWRPWFRFQHIYMWLLYSLLAIKWHFYDDFHDVIAGRIGSHQIARPRRSELAIFLGGKIFFFAWAFAIPLLFHPLHVVLLFYVIVAMPSGLMLALVFQIAHCVEESEFVAPPKGDEHVVDSWAAHQAQVTVNFSRRNPVWTWLVGGLNYHIEHHLFPLICHVNYPAISKIIEATCRDFGVRYSEHKSFAAGVASHYRWVRRMAMPNPEPSAQS